MLREDSFYNYGRGLRGNQDSNRHTEPFKNARMSYRLISLTIFNSFSLPPDVK